MSVGQCPFYITQLFLCQCYPRIYKGRISISTYPCIFGFSPILLLTEFSCKCILIAVLFLQWMTRSSTLIQRMLYTYVIQRERPHINRLQIATNLPFLPPHQSLFFCPEIAVLLFSFPRKPLFFISSTNVQRRAQVPALSVLRPQRWPIICRSMFPIRR